MREAKTSHNSGGEAWEVALEARLEAIRQRVTFRDRKQGQLLKLLAQPAGSDGNPKDAWNAWLELELAQGELDQMMKLEFHGKLNRS